MHSSGGVVDVEAAAALASGCVLSGPAGGVWGRRTSAPPAGIWTC
jgi:N-methylhydantoinase A/oxoprolinase/acetone carboxylase beta subunit